MSRRCLMETKCTQELMPFFLLIIVYDTILEYHNGAYLPAIIHQENVMRKTNL